MKGYIHSLQSLGTVDGPGIRSVVFTSGCPLRCIYCHNPDTWNIKDGSLISADELSQKILRLYPYIKDGGVTFSGGEPCLQAEFLCEVAKILRKSNLHLALDTSGCIDNEDVDCLLEYTDLVLLDIKMTSYEDYLKYVGTDLEKVMSFLNKLEKLKKETWIRHVVVPKINDKKEDIIKLKNMVKDFSCVKAIELLPYKNLCIEKYENLGIDFKLKDTPPLSQNILCELNETLKPVQK